MVTKKQLNKLYLESLKTIKKRQSNIVLDLVNLKNIQTENYDLDKRKDKGKYSAYYNLDNKTFDIIKELGGKIDKNLKKKIKEIEKWKK